MSATLKVLSAKKVVASHTLNQGDVLVIDARENSNYQLIDDKTGLGPQNIIAQRTGKDLNIFLEDGDMRADVVIKGYYGNENGEETSNLLVGQHENGGIYAYIPESGEKSDAVSMLAEDTVAPQALGGEDLGTAFWAFNPWWLLALVPLAAGIAIAAHNSDGNNDNADITAPEAPAGVTATNDVENKVIAEGASTNDNTPTFAGKGTAGDTIKVTLTSEDGATVTVTATVDTEGNWSVDTSALPDGKYSSSITATDPTGNESEAAKGPSFTVDTAAPAAPS
ncbi:Ig-like domain-containing protein, partial [Rodentibacter ratti]|uniref:Ig-like domain-containing protein n=1 Tax=Rodentibacter ratti TaxID=1906745 RepID=UPI002117FE5C